MRRARLWTTVSLVLVLGLAIGCTKSNDSSSGGSSSADRLAGSGTGNQVASNGKVLFDLRDDLHPIILLRTNLGNITVRLDAEKAPRTVYNFMSYASSGHYDQTIFHQIDPGYAILGGSYTSELVERQGRYPIPNEATNGLKNKRGTIAMARAPDVVDSATCEFFINLVDNPQLDHQGTDPATFGYCVFGEIVDGLEVLDKISKVRVRDTEKFQKLPVDTVMIQHVHRLVY